MAIQIDFNRFSQQYPQALDSDALLVTPNMRTQQALIGGFLKGNTESNVVLGPKVLTTAFWQAELWQQLSFIKPLPRLIGKLALKAWLFEVIQNDSRWSLSNNLGVCDKVLQAYQELCAWNLSIKDIDQPSTIENHCFISWVSELEEFCQQRQLLPDFLQINYLKKHLDQLQPSLPKVVFWVGFNYFTPAEIAFKQALEQLGVKQLDYFPQKTNSPAAQRVSCNDLAEELRFAATRAKLFCSEQPGKTMGIVVNQLSAQLDQVEASFAQVFDPDRLLPWRLGTKTPYNVSAARSLVDYPLIKTALEILAFSKQGFNLSQFHFLKTTPFIDWGEHQAVIGYFLHQLYMKGLSHYSLAMIQNAVKKSEFYAQLNLLESRLNEINNRVLGKKNAEDWAIAWQKSLEFWGWYLPGPGEKQSINKNTRVDGNIFTNNNQGEAESLRHQLTLSFEQALANFNQLGLIYAEPSLSQASDYLRQLLDSSRFQIPSDRTNIHILGILEATGLEFDQLILVGFNRGNWPEKARLNPFLPAQMQRLQQMPGSSAEREFAYSQNLSASLLYSSHCIFITQPEPKHDEPSPESAFFSQFPLVSFDLNPDVTPASLALTPDFDWVRDDQIPIEISQIKGGSYLLGDYATCPFFALSRHYLKLETFEPKKQGVDPRERGRWVHRSMEILWQGLKNSHELQSQTEEQLIQKVENAVDRGMTELNLNYQSLADEAIFQLERDKLVSQILEWLTIEKMRQPFEASTEVSKSLILGPLDLDLRIDRVDRLEDGRLEILDYKTGEASFKDWLGARPEEAQMPAYYLAFTDESVASLSYATLKTGQIANTGIWFNGEPPSFLTHTENKTEDSSASLMKNTALYPPHTHLASFWRANLENLAVKIAEGDMPVSPKSDQSCRFCGYRAFCRVNENQPELNTDLKGESL